MEAPTLSIVIPVYNVSAYLEKCVLSCFNQDISEKFYEVILVNDGSTDTSLQICKSLKIKYPEIKLITQVNKGLSGARNTGLNHAIGTYVWFVDSDDWIEKNTLGHILTVLKASVDLLWLGHDVWFEGKSVKTFNPKPISNIISGSDLFANHLDNLFYIWKFIYKREFLLNNDLIFLEGYLYEDLEFTPRALLKAEKCISIPQTFYHYLMRDGSIVNNVQTKNIEHRFFILDKLNTLLDSKISELYKSSLLKVIIHTVESTTRLAARSNIELPSEAFALIKSLRNNKEYNNFYSLRFKILTLYPKQYYSLFWVYHSIKNKLSKIKR